MSQKEMPPMVVYATPKKHDLMLIAHKDNYLSLIIVEVEKETLERFQTFRKDFLVNFPTFETVSSFLSSFYGVDEKSFVQEFETVFQATVEMQLSKIDASDLRKSETLLPTLLMTTYMWFCFLATEYLDNHEMPQFLGSKDAIS